jgi:hypothetical protein
VLTCKRIESLSRIACSTLGKNDRTLFQTGFLGVDYRAPAGITGMYGSYRMAPEGTVYAPANPHRSSEAGQRKPSKSNPLFGTNPYLLSFIARASQATSRRLIKHD